MRRGRSSWSGCRRIHRRHSVVAAARRLVLCATRPAVVALGELVEAWCEAGIHVDFELISAVIPDVATLVADHRALNAVLLVSPPRRAPATVTSAPFAARADGLRIPIALLPYWNDESLRRFA